MKLLLLLLQEKRSRMLLQLLQLLLLLKLCRRRLVLQLDLHRGLLVLLELRWRRLSLVGLRSRLQQRLQLR
jgi:hypothetical protein